jgi:hypothetical protein
MQVMAHLEALRAIYATGRDWALVVEGGGAITAEQVTNAGVIC